MKKSLSRAVLLVVAMLASSLSLVAVSGSPAHAGVTTESHLSRTKSVVRHGQTVTFTGYVSAPGNCTYCYPGKVYLERRNWGAASYSVVASADLTSAEPTPSWKLTPSRTATYRLRFAGYADLANASVSPAVKVSVKRNLHDNFRRATRTYYGKVTPSYNRRWVTIQKSNCSNPTSKSCRWSAYKTIKTSGTGAWSLRLPAHARRTHFRGYVKASNGYLNSWSNYYVTTYRY